LRTFGNLENFKKLHTQGEREPRVEQKHYHVSLLTSVPKRIGLRFTLIFCHSLLTLGEIGMFSMT